MKDFVSRRPLTPDEAAWVERQRRENLRRLHEFDRRAGRPRQAREHEPLCRCNECDPDRRNDDMLGLEGKPGHWRHWWP